MLIEWTQNESDVIYEIGLLKKGQRYQVAFQLGKQLVLQNKAKEIKEIKKEEILIKRTETIKEKSKEGRRGE